MKHQDIIDRLCEAVRTCFPKGRKIVFDFAEAGRNEAVLASFVWARISGEQLAPYDQKNLMNLVGAELVVATEKTAKFTGSLDGHQYELLLLSVS